MKKMWIVAGLLMALAGTGIGASWDEPSQWQRDQEKQRQEQRMEEMRREQQRQNDQIEQMKRDERFRSMGGSTVFDGNRR